MAEYVPGKCLSSRWKSTEKMCESCKFGNPEESDTPTCFCNICKKHEGEVTKFYCQTHNIMCCATCVFIEHKKCDDVCILAEHPSVEECLVRHRSLSAAIGGMKDEISEQISITKENRRNVESDKEGAIRKIDELQIRLLNKLEILRQEVVKETEDKERLEATKLNGIMETANKMEKEVKCVEKDLDDHKEMHQSQHFVIAMMKAEEKLGDFEMKLDYLKRGNKVKRFNFVENPTLMKLAQKVEDFGEVQSHGTENKSVKPYARLPILLYR